MQYSSTPHWQNSLWNPGTNPYYTNSLDDLKQSLKLDPKYIKACMIGCAWQERFLRMHYQAIPAFADERCCISTINGASQSLPFRNKLLRITFEAQTPKPGNQILKKIGALVEELSNSGRRVCRLGLALGSFTPWLQRPTEDDHFWLWTFYDFLCFRFTRSSNQNQNRDEVGIRLQRQCIAYPSLGCYSKRLDGKIVVRFFFEIATTAEIPLPSSRKLWQHMTTGWRWTRSAEDLVLASSQRHGYIPLSYPCLSHDFDFLLQFLPFISINID